MVWRETLINTQKINTKNLSFILTHRCYYCLNANRNDLLSFDFFFVRVYKVFGRKVIKNYTGRKYAVKTLKLSRREEISNMKIFIILFFMLLRMLFAFCWKDEIKRNRWRKIPQIVLLSFDTNAGIKTTWNCFIKFFKLSRFSTNLFPEFSGLTP